MTPLQKLEAKMFWKVLNMIKREKAAIFAIAYWLVGPCGLWFLGIYAIQFSSLIAALIFVMAVREMFVAGRCMDEAFLPKTREV